MQRVKEAIKEKVGRHRHNDNEYEARGGTAYTDSMSSLSSGSDIVTERPVAVGVAEVPVVVTEQERVHTGRMGEEVCGQKTFTEVEDRPVVKERVERILEHRPVEKEYVVETRYVGERPIPSATGATVIDVDERVVEAAEPGPKCPVNAGTMMDNAVGRNI